jgi:hypothetical protein
MTRLHQITLDDGGAAMGESERMEPAPLPAVQEAGPRHNDTLPGWILALGGVSELTVWPFLISVFGCGFAGYWIGAERFPGTGAEYVLAPVGGFLGIFIGFALAGAAVGALLGWLVGWGLWYAGKGFFGVECDPVFWWPIYIGSGIGGLLGFGAAIVCAINTVEWWRHRRDRRKTG